ncbi:hypothetical protein [Variovorax sp. LT1R16]|uniref:hypothetical protein n=1 Tax=Variovorax sp. LT1R16 TaxID=3443728 RepID=UPI003F48DB16
MGRTARIGQFPPESVAPTPRMRMLCHITCAVTPKGDSPFSSQKPDAGLEGIDVDSGRAAEALTAERAWMLPRGDVTFKASVDPWLHLAQAEGELPRATDRWLKSRALGQAPGPECHAASHNVLQRSAHAVIRLE